jgi:membrane associated rhomboid family serine protease
MFLPYADDPPPEGKFPWMNWLLIGINAAIFLAYGLAPDYEQTVMQYGFTPSEFSVTTLFTSLFLHAGWMHLLGNMLFLYLFGDNVENRLGSFLYLISYLLCGVAGSLCFYLYFPASEVPSIGASGAIFGVMGMYLLLFPRNRVRVFYFIFILIGRVVVPAVWVIGLWAGLELFYSHIQSIHNVESGIGHVAHAGGFLTGVMLAPLYATLGLIPTTGEELWNWLLGSPARRPANRDGNVIDAHYRMVDEPTEVRPSDPRDEIVSLLRANRSNEARRAWYQFAGEDRNAVLPVADQLEMALTLDKSGDRHAARDAYERLITHYHTQPFAAEANLALAGLLLRDLQETGNPREKPLIEHLLQQAVHDHPLPGRRALAQRWLQSLA